jgi:hypothetical protein
MFNKLETNILNSCTSDEEIYLFLFFGANEIESTGNDNDISITIKYNNEEIIKTIVKLVNNGFIKCIYIEHEKEHKGTSKNCVLTQ